MLLRYGVGLSVVLGLVAVAGRANALDSGLADGGAADASTDAAVTCDAGSGLACEMCDVSGYTPSIMAPPLGPMAAVCSDADISAFDTACGMAGSQSACATWESTASMACLGCLFTQATDAKFGLTVCQTTECFYNSAGCVDLTLNQVSQELNGGGSGSCGDLVNASFGCQDYACSTCATTDFATCAASASVNECGSYAAAEQSTTGACGALDGSASETACFPTSDSDIITMATLFCGGLVVVPDAGMDSGSPMDASTGKDSGTTPKDAGKDSGSSSSGDSGPDAGSESFSSGGCHCDAAGAQGGGNALVMMGLAGFVALALSRRRRRP
jgi:MYXO-CTERM domain-containing protein